jgi:SAM-dependent methyltransferase
MSVAPDYLPTVRGFFDRQYTAHERYWWRGPNRYSTDPAQHTAYNAAWLAAAVQRGPGRALDLGSGEGADAIKLARLGYQIDAVDVSAVACEKAERFARTEGTPITVRCEPIETAILTGPYDIVLMNGSLHYVRDNSGPRRARRHPVLPRPRGRDRGTVLQRLAASVPRTRTRPLRALPPGVCTARAQLCQARRGTGLWKECGTVTPATSDLRNALLLRRPVRTGNSPADRGLRRVPRGPRRQRLPHRGRRHRRRPPQVRRPQGSHRDGTPRL